MSGLGNRLVDLFYTVKEKSVGVSPVCLTSRISDQLCLYGREVVYIIINIIYICTNIYLYKIWHFKLKIYCRYPSVFILHWGIRILACKVSGLNFVALPLISFMDYKHTFCLFWEKAIVITS